MATKKSCEIILGTYEEYIIGFKYNRKEEEAEQTFAVHSHAGSIRCVTQSNDLVASGGSDDRIVVYNFKTRMEQCMLTHHNGTVNCLAFTEGCSHLLSGGQDGMLAVVRQGSWQLEKTWENAHKGAAILDIAIHSSGKLALTLGADATLRTWNLVKGRQAYIINLNSKSKEARSLHSLKWCSDGVRFVLAGIKYTDIWSIETGGVLKSIEHQNRISCCIWKDESHLIVGYEDGNVGFVDIETEEIKIHKAHESRVKCVSLYQKKLVTASSSGEIKVWSVKMKCLCMANAGCRLTCMCIVPIEKEVTQEEEVVDLNESSLAGNAGSPLKKNMKREVVIENEAEDEEIQIQSEQPAKKLKPEVSPKRKLQEVVVIEESTEDTPKKGKNHKKNKKNFKGKIKQENGNDVKHQEFKKKPQKQTPNHAMKMEIDDSSSKSPGSRKKKQKSTK